MGQKPATEITDPQPGSRKRELTAAEKTEIANAINAMIDDNKLCKDANEEAICDAITLAMLSRLPSGYYAFRRVLAQ